jgi:DNA-binding MltR family transcriptional regulator
MTSKKRRKSDRQRMALKSQDVQGFIDEFHRESDRATAILAAALLDEQLFQLLTAFLVDDEEQVELLVDSERPLGTFGARIRMTYCLGLITQEVFGILKIVKTIRNAFAHHLHGLSFADSSIAEECNKLRSVLHGPPDFFSDRIAWPDRVIFLIATLSARTEILIRTQSTEWTRSRCKVPQWETLVSWKAKK